MERERRVGVGEKEGNGRTERGEIGKREGSTHTWIHKDTEMYRDVQGCTGIYTNTYRHVQTYGETRAERERGGG